MLPLIPSVTGHHESLTVYVCSNQPFTSVLNRYHTVQNRRERLITAHIPCTFSNTRSKTRGARSQMESKEALECHPLETILSHFG